jgi:hypothetical protein
MFKKNTTVRETRLLNGKDAKGIRKRLEEQFRHLDGELRGALMRWGWVGVAGGDCRRGQGRH